MWTDVLDTYAGLLIAQYKNKTKAKATVRLFANSSVCDGLALALKDCFDLTTAFGNQLTIIGKIVGVPRNVVGLNLGYNFFNFTNYIDSHASNGFMNYLDYPDTSGWFLLDYNDSFTYTLNDEDMRTVIYLAIIQNSGRLTFKNIKEKLYYYFGGDIDVSSSTMSLTYTARTIYTTAMTVAQFLNLLPHPMCIATNVTYV